MPVYEYRCRKCSHQFEVQQSFTDDALTVCPECEGELRKVYAPIGISFKGSGFYKTDTRAESSSSDGSSSDSSSAGSDTAAATSSGSSDSAD